MAELPVATQCGTGAPAAPHLSPHYGLCVGIRNIQMTRVGIYSSTNDTHETGPPKPARHRKS